MPVNMGGRENNTTYFQRQQVMIHNEIVIQSRSLEPQKYMPKETTERVLGS